jgi:zinc protease
MKIEFRTDPEKYDELIPIIYEQLEVMAKNGPSEENLKKVKEYEVKAYGQNIVTNDYWDYVKYHEIREGIDFDKDYCQLVNGLTVESIRDFCKELLQPNHKIQVTMLPEK